MELLLPGASGSKQWKQFEFDDIVHSSGAMAASCLYCQTTTAANERLSAMTQAEMFMG